MSPQALPWQLMMTSPSLPLITSSDGPLQHLEAPVFDARGWQRYVHREQLMPVHQCELTQPQRVLQ